MSMKLPSVHLFFRHFFAFFLVVVFFWAFISPVSRVPTLEAPSFLHQLISFVNCQSINIHHIWITFLSGEVILWLWGFLLPGVPPRSFNSPVHLMKPVVNHRCPLIPVVDGLEWGLKSHQLECQSPGQPPLEQFDGQGIRGVNFRFSS
jgi:hypothetical protein